MIGAVHGGTVDFSNQLNTADGLLESFYSCWDSTTRNYSYLTMIDTAKVTGLCVVGRGV